MKLGFPVMIMVCSEWWAFELLIVMSGLLTVTDQAAHILLANISAQMFMVPLGLQNATCSVIGNAIGKNNPTLGKAYYKLTIATSFLILVAMTVALILF